MHGDLVGIWCGDQGRFNYLKLLGEATDGGAGGRVLCKTLLWGESRDSGGTTFDQHIQRGGGSSVTPLGIHGRYNISSDEAAHPER